MDCAIVSKDNSVNEAVSQGLAESRSAEKGVNDVFYRFMAQYSLFVLKVPLNTNQPTIG